MIAVEVAEQRVAVLKAIEEMIDFMNERVASTWNSTTVPPTYALEGGRKYLKVAMTWRDCGGKSVHCFVDALTGDVYKAATWKAPSLNGARYNILDAEGFELFKERFNWSGGYLYKK